MMPRARRRRATARSRRARRATGACFVPATRRCCYGSASPTSQHMSSMRDLQHAAPEDVGVSGTRLRTALEAVTRVSALLAVSRAATPCVFATRNSKCSFRFTRPAQVVDTLMSVVACRATSTMARSPAAAWLLLAVGRSYTTTRTATWTSNHKLRCGTMPSIGWLA